MRGIEARGSRAVVAAMIAACLLVGVAACGGSSSDGGSDGSTKTTQGDSSDPGGDSSDDEGDASASAGDLPEPCDLVPIETASTILGGDAAEPDATSSDVGIPSKSCAWQTQDSVDNPTLDGAGHILTLQVISPPETMSMDEFWEASAGGGDEDADVEGCDEAFWLGGMLSAMKDGVYLTGTAGLADDSADAKASATDLVAAACASLS